MFLSKHTGQHMQYSCSFLLPCWPGNPQRRAASVWRELQTYFLIYNTFIVIFGTLISILVIRNSLPQEWSLADALSEDVALSAVSEVKETKWH